MFSEIPFAMLISGGGSTATAIWNAREEGRLRPINFRLVISSRADATGIQRLIAAGFPQDKIVMLERKHFTTREAFGSAMDKVFRDFDITHFGQYGWIPYTPENICNNYFGINQHPGPLDPTRGQEYGFGGRGMHGRAVHAAVLAYTRRVDGLSLWTEATAHRVTAEIDGGNLFAYEFVGIWKNDDVDSLAVRVLPVEHRLQIRVLELLGLNLLQPIERGTPIVTNDSEKQVLAQCKDFATKIFPNG